MKLSGDQFAKSMPPTINKNLLRISYMPGARDPKNHRGSLS